MSVLVGMRRSDGQPDADDGRLLEEASLPLVIATILPEEGDTGVQTHIGQLRRYLMECDAVATVVTPFSWARAPTVPIFGLRLALLRRSGAASVAWYRYWHELFLRYALHRALAKVGACVVYAQCPLSARAALRARQGPHQRVVMAVHFRVSQADEWADKKLIKRNGTVFKAIRQLEREVIPQVDRLMYVSRWARDALLSWFPEASEVPYAVISNFVAPLEPQTEQEPLGDLVTVGGLEPVKNHRFILQVLAEANRAGRPLTLDAYGEGPLHKELQRMADSLGLEGQVRFRGYRQDVRNFLPRYRAYVHASYSESSSLAIMEAMAAGLPIVTANIGPIGELCDDGVEARFWPLDDPALAAKALIDLLDSEPVRLKAAKAARERFERDFDANVIAPRLLSFLMRSPFPGEDDLLKERQGARSTVHAYVINLARSFDRRAHITGELKRAGLEYEIVTAVDGRDLDMHDPTIVDPILPYIDPRMPAGLAAGTAGCALSHLSVYRKILADGLDAALVLEDDVMLPTDIGSVADAVAGQLTGAEVVLLSVDSPDPCKISLEGSTHLSSSRMLALPIDINQPRSAGAYIITREACERMEKFLMPVRMHADSWQCFYREGILDRVRCVVPLPVIKNPRLASTIGSYTLGSRVRGRLAGPFMRRKIPLLHQALSYRRERIFRQWNRSEVVDMPFIEKPSRL